MVHNINKELLYKVCIVKYYTMQYYENNELYKNLNKEIELLIRPFILSFQEQLYLARTKFMLSYRTSIFYTILILKSF